ncbi:MAG: KUP/HAK/KT family potassium transporter [Syntrophobacteraceae bacterium]|nr:KUP/HAK/KT family potassium transporter [Syntrophobacteraceae bacterium]
MLLGHPNLVFNPFYGLVPHSLLYPMVLLSTMATVIASQAMITGVFSLTQQAVQMGFSPRVHVVHTSAEAQGQIYIEKINLALMAACIGLVLVFRESSRLAGAYGIAVTATMGITSILYFFVATRVRRWPLWKALPIVAIFPAFDLSCFGANLLKILDGGWFTLAMALAITIAMVTWRDGRTELSHKMVSAGLPMEIFMKDIAAHNPVRVRGTAVCMTVSPSGVPHHLRHNHVLHERVIILSIRKSLFTFMSRNAQTPMTYFGLPPNRVVEIGVQVEL